MEQEEWTRKRAGCRGRGRGKDRHVADTDRDGPDGPSLLQECGVGLPETGAS